MSDTIFGKIIRGEIPGNFIYEDEYCVAINDIHPQAPVHVLAIPKGAYVSFDHFAGEAPEAELVDFHRTVAKVCAILGLTGDEGFRAITNAGAHGMQEVPHYHMHILGGRSLGRMLERG